MHCSLRQSNRQENNDNKGLQQIDSKTLRANRLNLKQNNNNQSERIVSEM